MQGNDVLIQNWFSKAKEAIVSTEKCIEINELYVAQNRVYYVIFYAVSALAQKYDFATSKHSQLKGWFSREFIKTGKIKSEFGKLYFKLFESRQKSDYTFTFKPDKDKLIVSLRLVKEFVAEIEKFL